MMMNSFSFCVSEKLFLSPSVLNDNLASILGWNFSPFSPLNISCHSFLTRKISSEKSDSLMEVLCM